MHLSRIVPAHTYRVDFTWLKRDFQVMSPRYREIRAKVGGGMVSCDWCEYAFVDGDTMHLAGRPKGRNWLLCNTCTQMADGGTTTAPSASETP